MIVVQMTKVTYAGQRRHNTDNDEADNTGACCQHHKQHR